MMLAAVVMTGNVRYTADQRRYSPLSRVGTIAKTFNAHACGYHVDNQEKDDRQHHRFKDLAKEL